MRVIGLYMIFLYIAVGLTPHIAMTHNRICTALGSLLALLAVGCATPVATLHPDVKSHTDIHPVRPDNKRSLSNIDSISEYRYTKAPKRATATIWTASAKYNNQGAMLRTKRIIVSNKRDTAYHITYEENFFNDKGQLVRYEKSKADTLFLVQTFVYNKRGQLVETTKQFQPTKYFIPEKWCYSYDHHGNQRSSEFYQNGELSRRTHTRYNRKGRPLTEAIYRGDGALLDSTIYTYNRHGDVIEERRILKHERNHLWGSILCEFFDEAENHRQQRHLWQKSHKENLGWRPIQYDTIGTRYTYHSKGKQALKQVWWSEWGQEWRDDERTLYNPDGGVAEKWQYYTYEHNGKPYKREVYNSQGLLTSLYERDWNSDTLTLKKCNEYNEQGVLIRQIEYDTFYSKEVHEVYNDRGDLIEYWQMASDGKLQLVRKEKYEYTDIDEGKSVTTVRNGKSIPSPIQSVTTIERERLADGGTSETTTSYKYDESGNIIIIIIHKRVDSPTYMLSWAKYYEGGEMTVENLLFESREEFFFRPEE